MRLWFQILYYAFSCSYSYFISPFFIVPLPHAHIHMHKHTYIHTHTRHAHMHTYTHTHTHHSPHIKSPRHRYSHTTTRSASCKACSSVCVHISKSLVGGGKTPPVQFAVGSVSMAASHVCTLVRKCASWYKKNTTSASCRQCPLQVQVKSLH